MTGRYLKLADVIERLGIDLDWLHALEAEDLVHPKRTLEDEVVISAEEVDRIRIIRILTEELEVNLAGAEVILHMREEMLAMQQQFDEILTTLVAEMRQRLTR